MIDHNGLCPECGFNWDGGDIYEHLRAMPEYAGKSDEEVKRAAASYGWYDDLDLYRREYPWRTEDQIATMPPEDRLHFSKIVGIYDRGKDRTVAWQCPECNACWDVFTNERIAGCKTRKTGLWARLLRRMTSWRS